MSEEKPHWFYGFVQAEFLKIGHTGGLNHRLGCYSSTNPFPFDSVVVAVGTKADCVNFETDLMEIWIGERMHGREWYRAEHFPDVLQHLEDSPLIFESELSRVATDARLRVIRRIGDSLYTKFRTLQTA